MLDSAKAREIRNVLLGSVTAAVDAVGNDVRDPWPLNGAAYTKNDAIATGSFGCVRVADCRCPHFGLMGGSGTRRCVIKTAYLRKRLDAILLAPASGLVSPTERAHRYIRRMLTELYVLTRLQHANLLHTHGAFIAEMDLHLVLPKLYVLSDLAEMRYEKYNGAPWPIAIMARILLQACAGLDFLAKAGLVHRDVAPDNILLTRNGTVKIAHFGQAKVQSKECVTPVGKETFMAFEKLHNLGASGVADCLSYGETADTWSLGVILLQLIAPDESQLPKDFAVLMTREEMPFIWLITNMLKLRARIVKAGGDELKSFLSNELLVVDPTKRPTPGQLLNSKQLKKWCSPDVAIDCDYLRKNLILDLDFANQLKISTEASNLDCLESKPIPAEFYWDDTWKALEDQTYVLYAGSMPPVTFRWGDPGKLFKALQPLISSGEIVFGDLCLIEPAVDVLAFDLMKQLKSKPTQTTELESSSTVSLPPTMSTPQTRTFAIRLTIPVKRRVDSLGFSTEGEESDGN